MILLPVTVKFFSFVLRRFSVLFFAFVVRLAFMTGTVFVCLVPVILSPVIMGAVTDTFVFAGPVVARMVRSTVIVGIVTDVFVCHCHVVTRMVCIPVIIRAVADAFTLDRLVMARMVEPAMVSGVPFVLSVTI